MIFTVNSLLKSLHFEEPNFWVFSFSGKVTVQAETFWRVMDGNKIIYTSEDHHQKFGLPQPIDLTKAVPEIFKNIHLKRIEVQDGTGDLILSFSDQLKIEIYITSSGYESYSFWIEDKRYIGLGGGKTAIFNE